jgi:hypothetical protein
MAEDSVLVRFTADLSDIKQRLAELESSIKKVDGQAGKAGKGLTDSFSKGGKALGDAKKNTDGLGASLKGVGDSIKGNLSGAVTNIATSIGAAFAVERLIAFGAASLEAFREAELNAKKLEVAVGVNGGLQEDFETLINQSSQLQEVTIFSDDQIQQVQTAALQFGLTTDQVRDLIPVLTDFASATGQDLQASLSAVVGGVNGNARALKQYGVVVDESLDKVERLADIQDQLTTKFKGQAEIVGETSSGAYQKFKNVLGEVSEQVGGFISTVADATLTIFSFALNGFKPLNDGLEETSANLFKTTEDFKKFGDAILSTNITLLAQQIEQVAASGGDVAKLTAELTKLKDQQLSIQIEGLDDDTIRKRLEELRKIPFILVEQQQELKILEAEEKKRNLNLLTSEKDFTRLSTEELQKRKDALVKANKEVNNLAVSNQIDLLNKELESRAKNAEKAQTAQESAYQKLIDSRKKFEALLTEVSANSDAERLKAQKDELEKGLQAELAAAGGIITPSGDQSGNLKAVDEFLKAKVALNAAYDKQIQDAELKSAQETADKLLALNQKNAEEDLKATLATIDKAGEAEKQKRIEDFLSVGDFSKEAYQSLQNELSNIDRNYTTAKLAEARRAGGDILNLEQKLTQDQINEINARVDAFEEGEQRKRELTEETIQAGAAFLSSVADLSLSGLDGELAAIEETKNANLARYDEDLAALEKRNERGALSDSQYEKQKAALLEKRKKDEDVFNKKSLDIKRQQATIDKQRAIFEIILNTSIAVTEQLANPILAALIAAAGAAQLATVVSQPIPKFAKGTRFLDNPAAPAGEDKILFYGDRGERIVPAKKNREYMHLYDQIETGKKKPLFDAIQQGREEQYIEEVVSKKTRKKKAVTEDVSSTVKVKKHLQEDHVKRSTVKKHLQEETSLSSTVKKNKQEQRLQEDINTSSTVIRRRQQDQHTQQDSLVTTAPIRRIRYDQYLNEERPKLSVVYRKSIADHSEFIQKNYTSHLLTTHRKESEERKQKTFASNIAESLYMNFTGLTAHDADRLRRKGTEINNTDEIAYKIAQAISDSIPKQYGTW